MTQIAGARAVVTGGASGIGLALAEALIEAGADVAIVDIAQESIDAAVGKLARLGGRVIGLQADVSSLTDVERVRDEVESTLGWVDIVANNAGVAYNATPIWDTPPEMVDWCYAVNVMGVYHGIRCFVPGMIERGHGHVLNTSSIGGFQVRKHPLWHQGLYASTKYAVVALSESLGLDLEGTGVAVSILAPAWVATNIAQSDRNRPDRFGGPTSGSQRTELGPVMAGGVDPRVVGALAVDAIQNERLYVFSHPDQREIVELRNAAVLRGFEESRRYFEDHPIAKELSFPDPA